MKCTECRRDGGHKLSCSQASEQRIELPAHGHPPDHLEVIGFSSLKKHVRATPDGPTPESIRVLAWVRYRDGRVGQIVAATAGFPHCKVEANGQTFFWPLRELTYCEKPTLLEQIAADIDRDGPIPTSVLATAEGPSDRHWCKVHNEYDCELCSASAPTRTGITVTVKAGLGYYVALPLIWKGDIGLNEQEAKDLHAALGHALGCASPQPGDLKCPDCGEPLVCSFHAQRSSKDLPSREWLQGENEQLRTSLAEAMAETRELRHIIVECAYEASRSRISADCSVSFLGKVPKEIALALRHARERETGSPQPGSMTHEEVVAACKNIGFDLTCSQCAACFFTGLGGSGVAAQRSSNALTDDEYERLAAGVYDLIPEGEPELCGLLAGLISAGRALRTGSAQHGVIAALESAIEFAEEGWSYASDYFKEKWDYDGHIAELRAALAVQRADHCARPAGVTEESEAAQRTVNEMMRESPDFVSSASTELAARNFQRINDPRAGNGVAARLDSAGVSMCGCDYPGESHDVDCPCYVDDLNMEGQAPPACTECGAAGTVLRNFCFICAPRPGSGERRACGCAWNGPACDHERVHKEGAFVAAHSLTSPGVGSYVEVLYGMQIGKRGFVRSSVPGTHTFEVLIGTEPRCYSRSEIKVVAVGDPPVASPSSPAVPLDVREVVSMIRTERDWYQLRLDENRPGAPATYSIGARDALDAMADKVEGWLRGARQFTGFAPKGGT